MFLLALPSCEVGVCQNIYVLTNLKALLKGIGYLTKIDCEYIYLVYLDRISRVIVIPCRANKTLQKTLLF